MAIVSFYAAIFAVFFVVLSLRTIGLRRANRVALGDGGHVALQKAIRAHGNFAEYVPFALLLIFFVQQRGAPTLLVHGLCLILLMGRSAHAYALNQVKEPLKLRVLGMLMTFAALIGCALYLLGSVVWGL